LSSPWIVSVYVISKHVIDSHRVQKPAQCTIDTGNHQGNIVSRDFLVNVLGYSADEFEKLTPEEERGGYTATETKLVPQGAVYLDWYYGGGTRIYRNMRFLISPFPMCDLIIGSRSIEKHRILAVPILYQTPIGLMSIADIRRASEQDLSGEMGRLHNSIQTKKRDEQESPDQQRAREIPCDEKQLQILRAGLLLRNADEALAAARKKKGPTAANDRLEAQKDVAEKEARMKTLKEELDVLQKALSVPIPSTSENKSTGTDLPRRG